MGKVIGKKSAKISAVIRERVKQFSKLLTAYKKRTKETNSLILPYVYQIRYNSIICADFETVDFIAYTDNVVFAAITFEATQLQENGLQVFIDTISISGVQQEWQLMLKK
jgi:hypothetical protein